MLWTGDIREQYESKEKVMTSNTNHIAVMQRVNSAAGYKILVKICIEKTDSKLAKLDIETLLISTKPGLQWEWLPMH